MNFEDNLCKNCGKLAEVTSENVWTSYRIIRNQYGQVTDFEKNTEVDDEVQEVHYWCETCFMNSASWD